MATQQGMRSLTQSLTRPLKSQLTGDRANVHDMVVIGRGKGEPLYTPSKDVADNDASDIKFADRETVLHLASEIAAENAELMRRLA